MFAETQPVDAGAKDQLASLYALSVELSTVRDLQTVLDVALQHCLDLTASQFGFIGLTSDDGRSLDIVAIQGFHPAAHFYHQFHVIPLRPNVFARAVLENRPIRSQDAMTDPGRVGQPHGHPPTHSFLGVPLRTHESPIGMIGVANRATPYEDNHESLLMTYAGQVAIAITNARLNDALAAAKAELEGRVHTRTLELNQAKEALAHQAEQLRQLLAETVSVQERERQRIAHDLHDGPNQLLVGAMLELKSASERLRRNDLSSVQQALTHTLDILHKLERDMRRVIFELRPPILDELGLVPSLRRCVEVFEQQTGIPSTFLLQGAPYRLPPNAEICVYRILQECLNNVAQHAHAHSVAVHLDCAPDLLLLSVNDDGSGFDARAVTANSNQHFGLRGSRERADMIGGKLIVQSEPCPGTGTTVQLWVPMSA